MSISPALAAAFYKEVVEKGRLWTIRDEGGFPAPLNGEGVRAQPFWSSRSRAEKIIAAVPAYSGFDLIELELQAFLDAWIPGLSKDGVLVGINWSGGLATGFDVEPDQVAKNLRTQLHR